MPKIWTPASTYIDDYTVSLESSQSTSEEKWRNIVSDGHSRSGKPDIDACWVPARLTSGLRWDYDHPDDRAESTRIDSHCVNLDDWGHPKANEEVKHPGDPWSGTQSTTYTEYGRRLQERARKSVPSKSKDVKSKTRDTENVKTHRSSQISPDEKREKWLQRMWALQLKEKFIKLQAEMERSIAEHKENIAKMVEQQRLEVDMMHKLAKFDNNQHLESDLKTAWARVDELLTVVEGVDSGRLPVPDWWQNEDLEQHETKAAATDYESVACRMLRRLRIRTVHHDSTKDGDW